MEALHILQWWDPSNIHQQSREYIYMQNMQLHRLMHILHIFYIFSAYFIAYSFIFFAHYFLHISNVEAYVMAYFKHISSIF